MDRGGGPSGVVVRFVDDHSSHEDEEHFDVG
jgi:hypothetical protein